ncbi:membrane-associated phospholipid phosphatase [Oxalobacteraceae bacterium GrIS 1.11]
MLVARLAQDGEFGLHLTAGVLLLALAAWVFGAITQAVMGAGHLTVLDVEIGNWFNRHAIGTLTGALLWLTQMHSVAGMVLLGALLALYFYLKKEWYWLLSLGAAVPGGMLLNVLLKYTFTRARPSFTHPLLDLHLNTYSFPSGHTVAATLFYGILAAYLLCHAGQWRMRAAIVAAAVAMVALVGLSRIYLGAHYLSDVLAAMAEGCAWLAVCITASSSLRRRRAARVQGKEKK